LTTAFSHNHPNTSVGSLTLRLGSSDVYREPMVCGSIYTLQTFTSITFTLQEGSDVQAQIPISFTLTS